MPNKEDSVLARKVRGPKMRVSGFPPMDSFCNAFASILATRSRKELRPGIDVSVFGYEVNRHGDYLRQLRAPTAIYLMSFPAVKGAGLIKAHPRLLGKVLDISLGGDGSFEESNFARALTSIDLSIYGRFVDIACLAFDEALREVCGRSAIGAPHKTRFEEQPGMIRIAPDQSEIFIMKLNFHIADDKRGAGLDFAVPVSTLEPIKRDLLSTHNPNDSTQQVWADHMLEQVMSMPMNISGIIDLGPFSVGELNRLEQGMLIALPSTGIDSVELRVNTQLGPMSVARGKLGSTDRRKALRLTEEIDPDFVGPLLQKLRD